MRGIVLAEAVGFEPTKGVNPCRFSRPVPSTARPRFLVSGRRRSPGKRFAGDGLHAIRRAQ